MFTSAKQIAGCRWSLPCIKTVMKTYKIMALNAKKDTEGVWRCSCSLKDIASEAGFGTRTVHNHIIELASEDIIEVQQVEDKRHRMQETYVFNLERLTQLYEARYPSLSNPS